MIPHIRRFSLGGDRLGACGYLVAVGFEGDGAVFGGVLSESAPLCRFADVAEIFIGTLEGGDDVFGSVDAEEFFAGSEEGFESLPAIGEDGGSAGGGFK